jgi:uncharacterized RDD family membrane protein YckC
LGKRLLSLQVLQDDGSRCRLLSAVIRELGYFVDVLFFGLIAYMTIQESSQYKRLGRQGVGRFVLGLMLGIMADIAVLMLAFLVMMNY